MQCSVLNSRKISKMCCRDGSNFITEFVLLESIELVTLWADSAAKLLLLDISLLGIVFATNFITTPICY